MLKKIDWLTISFLTLIGTSTLLSMSYLLFEGIRLDEAQSIIYVLRSVPELLRFISLDVHVPLYFLLLHFWVQLFGTEIIVARLMSLLFFILTLPVLYRLIREASTRAVALLTVALFTLSPFVMWYSSEARMYTLFAFVTTLQHLYFLRLLRSQGRENKFAFFVSTALGFYTHYFFVFLLITQGLYLVYITLKAVFNDPHYAIQGFWRCVWHHKGLFMRFMISAICAFLCFAPWVYYMIQSGSASNTQPLITAPTSYNILAAFTTFMFGFQNNSVQAFIVSLWPLSLVVLFLVFTKRNRVYSDGLAYFTLATFLPIMLVFTVSFVRPIFLSRYLILVTPTLFFLIAWALSSYKPKVSATLVSVFLLLMSGLLFYQNTSASTPVKENYKSVASYLEEQVAPRDVIAVSAPFTVYPIEYYYQGPARLVTIPEWNRFAKTGNQIPAFSNENLTKQIEGYKTQYVRVHVVLSYDQGYEDNIRAYLDNNFELVKAQRFSPGLEVRTYVLRYDVAP